MRGSYRFLPSVLVFLTLAFSGCGRAPDIVGLDNPDIPARSVANVAHHKIFILTTREATEDLGVFYSDGRAPELGLASVEVTVPPNHVAGELERPRQLPPDPRAEFTVVDPSVYQGDAAFLSEINAEFARRPPDHRKMLIFIHGYNNSTSDAILRLAQFVEDTDFKGVPVLFTWASAAKAPRYVYDLNSALIARVKIKQMTEILERTNASSVDIFAHSMGTFLTMEGLVDAQLSGRLNLRNRIETVTLASPDIDIDLFRTQIGLLPPSFVEKIFVLISKDDQALRVSRVIAGGVPRVGSSDAEELEKLGITVIDLSEIEDSSSGSHSKFAGSPEVVQIIGLGLNTSGKFGVTNTPGLAEMLAGVPIRILGR